MQDGQGAGCIMTDRPARAHLGVPEGLDVGGVDAALLVDLLLAHVREQPLDLLGRELLRAGHLRSIKRSQSCEAARVGSVQRVQGICEKPLIRFISDLLR